MELKDPVHRWLPAFASTSGCSAAGPPSARSPSRWPTRCGCGTSSPTPRASPTGSTTPTRSTPCTGPPASSGARPRGSTPPAASTAWAGLPLLFQPGTEWNYGVSTDVLGHLVEVVSRPAARRVPCAPGCFEPLGMHETGFALADGPERRPVGRALRRQPGRRHGAALRRHRSRSPPTRLRTWPGAAAWCRRWPTTSRSATTCAPAARPTAARSIGHRTLDYMVRNHLPGGADLEAFGRPLFAETTFDGVGFGLGFSVTMDPVQNKVIGSRRRVRVGRRRQHGVLGRPRRGPRRACS